jgi:hypothetical protein
VDGPLSAGGLVEAPPVVPGEGPLSAGGLVEGRLGAGVGPWVQAAEARSMEQANRERV